MILYKDTSTIRDFYLSKVEVDNPNFEVVSDTISDDSTLYPIISDDIYAALKTLPDDYLSTGFVISSLE